MLGHRPLSLWRVHDQHALALLTLPAPIADAWVSQAAEGRAKAQAQSIGIGNERPRVGWNKAGQKARNQNSAGLWFGQGAAKEWAEMRIAC